MAYQIQPAAVWLTGITEGSKYVTSQWNPLSQVAVHATKSCEFKRQLEKFTEKLPEVVKASYNPLLRGILTPTQTPTGRAEHRSITHSMLAPSLFPLVNIYFCPITVDFPFTALPTNKRTHGKEHGESWPQTGNSQQGGYSSATAPSQEPSNSSCTSVSTVSQLGISTCACFISSQEQETSGDGNQSLFHCTCFF